jgi:hypothetical protein
MTRRPCCLDGAGAPEGDGACAAGAGPLSRRARNEGARNAGRAMRPQPHAQCKQAHELVTTAHQTGPAFRTR